MPVLDQTTFTTESNDLNLLAAVLHPTKQARSEAVRRGQALAKAFGGTQFGLKDARRVVTDTPAG